MEDDDEFGDLYMDVLKPFSSASSSAPPAHHSSLAPPPSHPPIALEQENNKNGINDDDDGILYGVSRPNSTAHIQSRPLDSKNPGAVSGFMLNSTGGGVVPDNFNLSGGVRVLEREDAKLPDRRELLPAEDTDMKFDIEEGISNQVIPGLSSSGRQIGLINLQNMEDARGKDDVRGLGGEEDDWDSESDDDLQIVLNDVNQGAMGMDGGGIIGEEDREDDEDGDPLVIVADGDPTHQGMEEQEWGEDAAAKVADGEKKEGGEAGKGSAGNAVIPKIGYSNHGYHHPFHSQFKVSVKCC